VPSRGRDSISMDGVAGFTITSLWNGSGERSNIEEVYLNHYSMVSERSTRAIRVFFVL